jgi:hypothetical protein
MVAHACDPSSQEAEAGGPEVKSTWSRDTGQLILHSKTLFLQKKMKPEAPNYL